MILGYDLWRDDGHAGDFIQLFYTNTVTSLRYTDYTVEYALRYRYKYRARNINGWGQFSNLGYLIAASVP